MVRRELVCALSAVLMGVSVSTAAWAARPGQDTTNWPCRVDFVAQAGDASTDLLKGEAKGDYVNGTEGVTCVIVPPGSGSMTDGDLSLYFAGKSRRSLYYANNSGTGGPYSAFYDKGSLRVRGIATVTAGTGEYRPFVAYSKVGKFLASNEGVGDVATTLAHVTAIDSCTWQVTFPASDPMELWDGNGWTNLRGYYPLPFTFTVTRTDCP